MAEHPPPPSSPPPAVSNNPDPIQYWCYQCDKRVPVETRPDHPDIICFECKNGFVESISVAAHTRQVSDEDTPAFGNEFLQVLRLIAQAAREDDEPPPPPSDHPAGDNDYLRIELDGWDNGNVNLNEDEDEDEDQEDPYQGDQDRARFVVDDDDDIDDDEHDEEEEIQNRNLEEDEEDFVRRERRDVLRLRLRDFASRAASRRNRILDWAEILMGLEDQSIEFRLQVPGDDDGYVGNPGDYVDAAGYEALLQNLAENDTSGRRGAPPAAKLAVEGLQTVELNSTNMEICAICKDRVFNNEEKIAKKLQCGHMYHGDCIVPWLGSRNTCPVCRYELPTDDPEYEEDRKKRSITVAASATDHGCSSSSGGGGD
ncbi:E3 ubiquitin-protein ligase CIP8 [Cynara cardunculus var. scolymus]|nr:E3 ubiquitin-protein ligase CIP8 [Cynara cardunculus var. scolymus]